MYIRKLTCCCPFSVRIGKVFEFFLDEEMISNVPLQLTISFLQNTGNELELSSQNIRNLTAFLGFVVTTNLIG